ncbi:MAG: SPOR domain-containing protein [Rhodospirillales bacterium]
MTGRDDTRIEPTAVPDPYDDEPEEDLEEEESPRRRAGRVLPIVVASLAVVGFVVIVYYAYQQGIRAGSEANPPLIRADDSPAKVRPAAPGGMEVPNQTMRVYELGRPGAQSASAGPERILPKPEEPMQRPAAPAAGEPPQPAAAPTMPVSAAPQPADAGVQTGVQLGAGGGVVTPPPPPLPGSGQTMPAPAPSMAEVQAVLTPPAKPSTLAVPPPPPPPPRSGLVPGGRAPATPAVIPQPAPAVPSQPQVAAASTPGASASASQRLAAAAPAGGARVPLMAAPSPEGAEQEAKKLAAKFPDLLGGLSYEIETHTDSRGTFYRVLFGLLATRGDATRLCETLRAKNQGCLPK